MNIKKIFFLFFLISLSVFSFGQIISKSANISESKNSFITNQSSIRIDINAKQYLASLNVMNDYNWETKETHNQNRTESFTTLFDPSDHIIYGLKLTQHFNYPILQLKTMFVIKFPNIIFSAVFLL